MNTLKHLLLFLFISGFTVSCNTDKDETGIPDLVNDADGNVYETVTINGLTWFKSNLATTKYNDGTDINFVVGNSAWQSHTEPSYCWYNDNPNYKDPYGALYDFAAMRTGKLCPKGWHVSTNQEWYDLKDILGGVNEAGGHLKDTTTVWWTPPNEDATNSTGFSALPGGVRWGVGDSDYVSEMAYFAGLDEYGLVAFELGYNHGGIGWHMPGSTKNGYSVRCVFDY